MGHVDEIRRVAEAAANRRKAKDAAIAAHHRARILRAQYIAQYGRDPLGGDAQKNTLDVVTRRGRELVGHLVEITTTKGIVINVYPND